MQAYENEETHFVKNFKIFVSLRSDADCSVFRTFYYLVLDSVTSREWNGFKLVYF